MALSLSKNEGLIYCLFFVQVKLLEVKEDEGKIVVSQRRVLSDGKLNISRGQVLSGTVTGLRKYGVFVEMEGGDAGLLHVSQVSSDRVENIDKLFTIGQRVKVMVLDFDKVTGKIAFSTKALEANPGDMLRDMNSVFENADKNAKAFLERLEAERITRETATMDIVAGLGNVLGNSGGEQDGTISVAESIESILASISKS
jgi:small subunit ribosomal protein S1